MKQDHITFQIVKLGGMSRQGMRIWGNNTKVSTTTRRGVRIEELKSKNGGIPKHWVNSKQKLASYVFRKCGAGTFDIMVYLGNRKPHPYTAIRMELRETDNMSFQIDSFDTRGNNNKFSRRFGVFKRVVGWHEEN